MDLRNTLRYLGVPIITKAYMFSDNKSVATCSTIPQSILNKTLNIFSYHRAREAVTAMTLEFLLLSDQERSEDNDTIRKLLDFEDDIILLKPD